MNPHLRNEVKNSESVKYYVEQINQFDYISYRSHEENVYCEVREVKSYIEQLRWKRLQTERDSPWAVIENFKEYDEENIVEWFKFFDVHKICLSDFCNTVKLWINKTDYKKNTLLFVGPTNSGKSLLTSALGEPWLVGYINNIQQTKTDFVLTPLLDSTIGIIEEIFLTPEVVNDFKRVLEGGKMCITMKYHNPQCLERKPIVCTNQFYHFGRGYLPQADEDALLNRCWKFNLHPNFHAPSVKLKSSSLWYIIDRELHGVSSWSKKFKESTARR